MIFVTVGTHEQPFDRLIKKIDELIKNEDINNDVFIQTGYSTYEPKNCKWSKFLDFNEMNHYMNKAETVICHGGPATFMQALSLKKRTIVVPRQKKFNEHVNDHQLIFARQVKEKGYPIELVTNIDDLSSILKKDIKTEYFSNSHNKKFVKEFGRLVGDIVNG